MSAGGKSFYDLASTVLIYFYYLSRVLTVGRRRSVRTLHNFMEPVGDVGLPDSDLELGLEARRPDPNIFNDRALDRIGGDYGVGREFGDSTRFSIE
jgi:hypothetical protein